MDIKSLKILSGLVLVITVLTSLTALIITNSLSLLNYQQGIGLAVVYLIMLWAGIQLIDQS